jgi:uncharacterized protein DUF4154
VSAGRLLARLVSAVVLAAIAVFGVAATAGAQDMEVPVAIQVPLFLKVISFDRHLTLDDGAELVVAVAYQSRNRTSATTKDEVTRALDLARSTTDGQTVRVITIDLDRESLAEALGRERATMLYVAPLRALDIAHIATCARAAGVTTVTGVPRYVTLGLAVSARLERDRPKLLINVEAARLEGADFRAELLKLAQVSR